MNESSQTVLHDDPDACSCPCVRSTSCGPEIPHCTTLYWHVPPSQESALSAPTHQVQPEQVRIPGPESHSQLQNNMIPQSQTVAHKAPCVTCNSSCRLFTGSFTVWLKGCPCSNSPQQRWARAGALWRTEAFGSSFWSQRMSESYRGRVVGKQMWMITFFFSSLKLQEHTWYFGLLFSASFHITRWTVQC